MNYELSTIYKVLFENLKKYKVDSLVIILIDNIEDMTDIEKIEKLDMLRNIAGDR